MSEWELFNASTRVEDEVPRADVCACGSESFWYDSQSEAHYCEQCNMMIRKEHSMSGNWESLGEEAGSHNSCGSQFLSETCSRTYVVGNRALSRLELHSSSNNHETSTIKTWEAINKKAARLPLHFREKIKTLYALYYKDHLNRDKVKWGIIAAFARYTCLINGTPRNDADLAAMFGVTTRKLRAGITLIETFLHENETIGDIEKASACENNPEYLIVTYGKVIVDEIVNRLDVTQEHVMGLCRKIIGEIDNYIELATATVQVLAASIIYAVSQKNNSTISAKTIADLFGVGFTSVINYSKFIIKNYDILTR